MLGEGTLEVRPPDDGKRELLFQLQWLVTALPEVIVQASKPWGVLSTAGGVAPLVVATGGLRGMLETAGQRGQTEAAARPPAPPTRSGHPAVQGIPTVDRAVINRQEKDQSRFHILVEGTNLQVGGAARVPQACCGWADVEPPGRDARSGRRVGRAAAKRGRTCRRAGQAART